MTTKKILWLSRHAMTSAQKDALIERLGDIYIVQANGTFPNVHVPFTCSLPEEGETTANERLEGEILPVKELIGDFDVIAIVAPIHLQQQILAVADDKPVIMALNGREITPDGKVNFVFQKWEQLIKIDIVKEDF